jgi:hypothetical protein
VSSRSAKPTGFNFILLLLFLLEGRDELRSARHKVGWRSQ